MGPEELLDRYFASDDEEAMAELVRQTRPKLLRVARKICGADAEDAVAVRSATAGPLAGPRVSVRAKAGDRWGGVGRVSTDAEGRVLLPVVEAERYGLWANASGHQPVEATVERLGRRTHFDIDLAARA